MEMKNKQVLLIAVLLLFIGSCKDAEEPNLEECPDVRFVGEWVCPNRVGMHDKMTYYFCNSNKLGKGSISLLSPEYGFVPSKPLEWKMENGKYYTRLWDANASWEIFNLRFIDENSITIDGNTYIKTKTNFDWGKFL
jgi:hypothetical protein